MCYVHDLNYLKIGKSQDSDIEEYFRSQFSILEKLFICNILKLGKSQPWFFDDFTFYIFAYFLDCSVFQQIKTNIPEDCQNLKKLSWLRQ